MQQQQLNRLYQKILSKQATHNEEELFFGYLAKNPDEKKLFDRLYTMWGIRVTEEKLINSDEKFEEIWKKGIGTKKKNLFASVSLDMIGFTIRVAATLLITGLLTYFFMVKIMNSPIETEVRSIQTISIQNPAGQQQKIRLPDGTSVWLNAKSELTYPSEFAANERKVTLEGEGYFEVTSDSLHPFIVKTAHLSVTALGTSFNIMTNPGDERIQVSLFEGKVSVKKDSAIQKLEPGWCYKYQPSTGRNETAKFDKDQVLAWKNGILLFNGDNLEETISKLEKWYGVTIAVKGTPGKKWKLNARFDNENIKVVMENLSFTRDFSYTLKNNHISIFFN